MAELAKGRYIVVDYSNGQTERPIISCASHDLEEAQSYIEMLQKDTALNCAVLYDTMVDEVIRIMMRSEPIHLVEAIEAARRWWDYRRLYGRSLGPLKIKNETTYVVEKITSLLSGDNVSGTGPMSLGHYLAPFYALKEDTAGAAGAGAAAMDGDGEKKGRFGGEWPNVCVPGPIEAPAGGMLAGLPICKEVGTDKLVKAFSHPRQCAECKGVGIVPGVRTDPSYKRCTRCSGYGYTES